MAGKYFEEFRVGEVFKHQPSRTVTETDNLLFTALTMNVQPLHLDAEFSKNTEFGQVLLSLEPSLVLPSRTSLTYLESDRLSSSAFCAIQSFSKVVPVWPAGPGRIELQFICR